MTRTGWRITAQALALIATILFLIVFRHSMIAFLFIGLGFIVFENILALITKERNENQRRRECPRATKERNENITTP